MKCGKMSNLPRARAVRLVVFFRKSQTSEQARKWGKNTFWEDTEIIKYFNYNVGRMIKEESPEDIME